MTVCLYMWEEVRPILRLIYSTWHDKPRPYDYFSDKDGSRDKFKCRTGRGWLARPRRQPICRKERFSCFSSSSSALEALV